MNDWFGPAFGDTRIMAILRGYGPRRTVELAERGWDLGIRCLEVPLQSEESSRSLKATIDAARERQLPVGAGTIITVEGVHAAHALGAAFTVAPGFDPDILRASSELGMPHLPGVATPSDIQRALALGLRWVKAFPASELGTGWFKAMRGPFPHIAFVATGGMNVTNASAFLNAGADVIALGSALANEDEMRALRHLPGAGV